MTEHGESAIAQASSEGRSRRSRGAGKVAGFVANLNPGGAVLPLSCAGCGALASSSRAEVRASDGASLIVPYCDACHMRVSTLRTRGLSSSVAACLVALTLASALPIVLGKASVLLHLVIVLGGTLAATWAGIALSRALPVGRAGTGRAVWWTREGELACTSQAWAAELAERNRCALRPAELSPPLQRWLLLPGPVLGIVVVAVFYPFHHPIVRVVNLTPTRLTVWVDGQQVADVEPTSAESTRAGVERRIAAGARLLEARDSVGRVISRQDVSVESGALHLFAPASEAYCFWLESTQYGRAEAAEQSVIALDSGQQFWILRSRIDSWFSPNPAPEAQDRRSTGGVLTALRQAPCREAPPQVYGAESGREPGVTQ